MDSRLSAAFAAAPRERFLPPEQRGYAHVDQPLRLSHGQTNSQPTTVGNMLELLDVRPGNRVLDVGAGSGWTTALLAHLVGEGGRVLGVERIRQLQEGAAAAVRDIPWAEVRLARTGVLGLPELGPFDRILVSAEARALPAALVDQLAPGGVMVIPVRGVMLRVRADDDGARSETSPGAGHDDGNPGDPWEEAATLAPGVTITRHGWYSFVPLVED